MPLYTQQALGPGRRLVSGIRIPRSEEQNLLHLVEDDTSMVHSFFPTPGDSFARADALHYGYASFAVRGDTVAAVSALTDTLYVFGSDGTELERVHIPFREFLSMPPPSTDGSGDPQGRLDEGHLISDLHWLADGSMVFQYQRPHDAIRIGT